MSEEKKTILIVDDTPKNIQLVANVLRELHLYKILFAQSGKEALTRIASNRVDLILLDIMMPDMDGFEVAEMLKSDSKYAAIPIIFLTAYTDIENIKKGFALGASDYISKPFNAPELIVRVKTHLELYHSRQQLKGHLAESISLLEQYKLIVDESDIVSKTDLRGVITYVNDLFVEISGFSREDLIGKPHSIVRHPDTPSEVFAQMWDTIKAKKIWKGEVKNLRKNGDFYIVTTTVMPILDRDGNIIEYISTRHDMTSIHKLNQEIEDTQHEVIYTMGAIGEYRSKETGNHVKRVAEYTYTLGKLYGLNDAECELIREASPMHDIGKVAIPDAILNKPAKLTSEEFEIMKQHALHGYNMISNSQRPIFKAASIIALEHHEKWDGTGYPYGKKSEEIHIYGRITALADVFDALSCNRVYKKKWELTAILEYFSTQSGVHFDPALVSLFLEHLPKFLAISERYKDL